MCNLVYHLDMTNLHWNNAFIFWIKSLVFVHFYLLSFVKGVFYKWGWGKTGPLPDNSQHLGNWLTEKPKNGALFGFYRTWHHRDHTWDA